ncbi:MAG: SMP-30/gluconolactonase/LRE family protein [Pseudomonadota bacterium]
MTASGPLVIASLKTTIAVSNGLGECILWDDRKQRVLWTDMPGRTLYSHCPRSGKTRSLGVHEDLCSFAMIENSDDLICAFQSGLALMDRNTADYEWLYRIDHPESIRLNDGRVDRQGRFWVGSLIDNAGNRPEDGLSGELFRLDANGEVTKHLDGIGISNSLCWSPGGQTLYFADTPTKEIVAFEFRTASGTLGKKRRFCKTPEAGGPDGSVVDADGFLWNAEWGQGRVVRYAPDGRVDAVVQLPVSNITCVTFGGRDLADLYVTTARYGLSDRRLRSQPQAGDVFVFRTSVRGLPEERYISQLPKP